MIIERDFLDHWKTIRLTRALGTPTAPFYLIRLWGHCEARRTDNLAVDAEAIASICGFSGNSKKLIRALLDCPWIREIENGYHILGWRERNSRLLASIENGKKGGRPRKQNQDSPSPTQDEPSQNPQDNPAQTKTNSRGNLQKPDKIRLDKSREEVPLPSPRGQDARRISEPEPQKPTSTLPPVFAEKKESGAAASHPHLADEVQAILHRVCPLFGRNPRRSLGYEGQQAFPGILPIPEEELAVIEWFYGLQKKEGVRELQTRRNSVEKLLANWPEEVDRARTYRRNLANAALESGSAPRPRRPEPEGWQEIARNLSDDPDRCHIPATFWELPGDIRRDIHNSLADRAVDQKKEKA